MLFHEGSDSFLEEEIDYKEAKYVVVPTPLDMTTTYLNGTKFGPLSIIEASKSLENYNYEFDFDVKDMIFTTGQLQLPADPKKAMDVIKETVSDILNDEKIPIIVGGEHLGSYGSSLAFGDDVVFLVFDAHGDFKSSILGVELTHASTSRLISAKKKVMILGLRSFSPADMKDMKTRKVGIVYSNGFGKKIGGALRALKGKKVYISVDMDVFDPSIAPGVGTPQPDGILYNDFIEALRIVASRAQLVGMDVMETRRTDSKTTEILAAKIITDFIAAREKNL